MVLRYLTVFFAVAVVFWSHRGLAEERPLPDKVYSGLEYVFSLPQSSGDLDPREFDALVEFLLESPSGSSGFLKEREDASGAFHSFTLKTDYTRILDYVYSPDIPNFITMPSSLREQRWLTPETLDGLRDLPRSVESTADIRLLRGQERETITPDTNTGGYYSYDQQRVVALFPGPYGPVFISASIQDGPSEVGKKGCVVGDDNNWNYLYSGVKGLNKMGIGWVDSFLYHAQSVLVYVTDSTRQSVRVGSFKWLNAGWAQINMVKSSHILEGIKRFAEDFKSVMESPGLPDPEELAQTHKKLADQSEERLREMIAPYFDALAGLDSSDVCSSLFAKQLTTGDYLRQMSRGEMVRVLFLEYVKEMIGKNVMVQMIAQPDQLASETPIN
jgi:hypothetical protein